MVVGPGGSEVPSGIVTFLFTDVEGSTRLWAADAANTARSLEIHDQLIRHAIESHDGYVFGWAGDHFRGAFVDPDAAVRAALAAQVALRGTEWGDGPALRVRMGLHRGRATQRDGDYFGPVPNTAARIEALAGGGQILLSDAVAAAVEVGTLPMGTHRLRDVPEPMALHQVGFETHRPLRSIDPKLSTLPNPGSPIVGRHAEVAEVRAVLESSSLVTLTGVGGCGKTRLAVEIAYQELPSRPDGCYFADLSAVSDESELPAALASAVRLELSSIDGLEKVAAHLASIDALLVLDNCEHIVDGCAEFAELLLQRSSSTALMATTRQRLGVDGEVVVAVPPLDHRHDDSPAVELFVQRAAAVNSTFRPDADSLFTIGQICERLDGMPLAIELAAARMAVLSPSEILDRMADRFRLLSGGRGRQRRRALQATLDWSYELLDEDEQSFFRRLGLFVGTFDLPAAVSVAGVGDYEAMDLLESLVAKSLVAVDEGLDRPTARYRLLETVRIYAGDHLARAADAAEAHDAHLGYFQELARTTSFVEAGDLRRAATMRWDWPNIASVLEYLTDQRQWDDAAHVAFGCHALWESVIPAIEGRRWLEMIRGGLEAGELRDWMTYLLGSVTMQLDDFTTSHQTLDALTLQADAAPEPQTQAAGLFSFLTLRQRPDRTAELLEQARALITTHHLGPEHKIPMLWSGACVHVYEARYAEALEGFEEAFSAARELDHDTTHVVMTGLSLAAMQVINHRSEDALGTLGLMDWSCSIWDSSPIVEAVALIDLERSAEAANLVIEFGYDALRGRLPRMANDAMLGLAALAINRGETEHGWKLLQQGASPRTPFTIGMAEALAARIGYGDALRQVHRGRQVPLSELDASDALRDELERIRSNR